MNCDSERKDGIRDPNGLVIIVSRRLVHPAILPNNDMIRLVQINLKRFSSGGEELDLTRQWWNQINVHGVNLY